MTEQETNDTDRPDGELDHKTIAEVLDEVEEELVAEDMMGASREQVVRGTIRRVRRRLKDQTEDGYTCPDCGAELNVLYVRNEFDPTVVVGFCSESGIGKSVPLKEELHR